jgi:hypothetical protein
VTFPPFKRFSKVKAKQFSALRVIKFGEPIKLENTNFSYHSSRS